MTPRIASAVGFVLLVAACARPKDDADTTSVLAIDTVKPATTALQSPDTTATTDTARPEKAPPTKTSTGTKTKTRDADSATKQGATKELGRDSIIRVDLKNKRRQLPPADTTKRP